MVAPPLTIIVGAGISGLTCAYTLLKSGCEVLVFEAGPRPGGMIQSVNSDGYLFELGPQSFSSTPILDELCVEFGLTDQRVQAPRGLPRFVLIEGKLTAVPMSPPAFLTSGLLDWKSKLAVLTEILRTTHPPQSDESIAAFTRRKFSTQLLDRIVAPFVSGIYAGDPEQISLRAAFPKIHEAERAAGSVVRGIFKAANDPKEQVAVNRPRRRQSLISFQKGNSTLVSAIAAKLGSRLRLNAGVVSLSRTEREFILRVEGTGGGEELRCHQLVLATPARTAAELLRSISPAAASSLSEISYAPVAVMSLAYRREQVCNPLSGFGFLVPRSAGIRTLGTVWNSALFRHRAAEGHVLLTSFIGGATDAEALGLSDGELSATVHNENARILSIKGDPAMLRITRIERAIPQYNLGHTERLRTIRDSLDSVPGLWFTGNYWDGPAVGSCIEHGMKIANQIRRTL